MGIRTKRWVKGGLLTLFFSTGMALSIAPAQALVRPIMFPVNGPATFRDDFAEPRGGGTREHLGIDIISPKMTPVVAAVDGVVSYVVRPQASWGYSVTIRDEEGYQYRYLHLNNDTPGTDDGQGGEANAYAPGMERGARVLRGDLIGWVGDSGNAEEAGAHLHFEIRQPDRTPINPYESLVAARPQGGTTPTSTPPASPSPDVTDAFTFTKNLSEGSTGEEVRQLQTALQALGYFEGTATGYFGPVTREAVMAFQEERGIDPIGSVGPKTREALNKGVAVTSNYVFTKTLKQGASGEEVWQLQMTLQKAGYFQESPTGYFGPITHAAVVNFQKANGIEPLGLVGPITRAALNVLE